jgi:chorismate mutase
MHVFDRLNRNSAGVVELVKINGVPKQDEYLVLPFGRRIEYAKKIEEFKTTAQKTYLSQKRRNWRSAVAEARRLYKATQYYARFHAGEHYFDDTFEFYYKTA